MWDLAIEDEKMCRCVHSAKKKRVRILVSRMNSCVRDFRVSSFFLFFFFGAAATADVLMFWCVCTFVSVLLPVFQTVFAMQTLHQMQSQRAKSKREKIKKNCYAHTKPKSPHSVNDNVTLYASVYTANTYLTDFDTSHSRASFLFISVHFLSHIYIVLAS